MANKSFLGFPTSAIFLLVTVTGWGLDPSENSDLGFSKALGKFLANGVRLWLWFWLWLFLLLFLGTS